MNPADQAEVFRRLGVVLFFLFFFLTEPPGTFSFIEDPKAYKANFHGSFASVAVSDRRLRLGAAREGGMNLYLLSALISAHPGCDLAIIIFR